MVKRNRKVIVPILVSLTLSMAVSASADRERSRGGFRDAWGPRYSADRETPRPQPRHGHGLDSVRHWNEIAINADALDHTPVAPGENRVVVLKPVRGLLYTFVCLCLLNVNVKGNP